MHLNVSVRAMENRCRDSNSSSEGRALDPVHAGKTSWRPCATTPSLRCVSIQCPTLRHFVTWYDTRKNSCKVAALIHAPTVPSRLGKHGRRSGSGFLARGVTASTFPLLPGLLVTMGAFVRAATLQAFLRVSYHVTKCLNVGH